MGTPAPHFSVYPLPGKLPINAAILASQHVAWEVSVVDGTTVLDIVVEPFASALAIRPAAEWPAGSSLEVVARLDGEEYRHPFETADMSHDLPPLCEWPGPSRIHPRGGSSTTAHTARTFSLPTVVSTAGALVLARLHLSDRGRTWSIEVGVASARSKVTEGGPPEPFVALPGEDVELSDDAQIIGVTLVDVAGNQSSYGTVA